MKLENVMSMNFSVMDGARRGTRRDQAPLAF